METRPPGGKTPLPLKLHWQTPANPLPVRAVRWPARARRPTTGLEAPPYHASGPVDRPFDFCAP